MVKKIIQKNLKCASPRVLKKSNLDILTEENDHLLKSLKRPGSNRFA